MKKKMYTIIWTDKAKKMYGVSRHDIAIIALEDRKHGIKFNIAKKKVGRPKMRWAEVYPIFKTKEEAEAYRDGNNDWMCVEVELFITK